MADKIIPPDSAYRDSWKVRAVREPKREIRSKEKNCPVCAGSGRDINEEPDPIQAGDCRACRGTGKL